MNTLILAYHRVNDWSKDTLAVHPAVFRKQLNYLAGKYRFVPLSEVVAARTRESKSKERLAAVTFDDGYSDNFRCACPVLKELGFTATFFLTAGYIGTDKLLPRDEKRGDTEKDRLLNWPEISEMEKMGFTFGSHSLTHANLASGNQEQVRKEVAESKTTLEAHLREPANFFCYPFGSYSPGVEKMVADAGYQAAFVTPPVRSAGLLSKHRVTQDRYALRRVGIYHHTAFWQFYLKTF
ncbi:MAG: polysaccharide deacetylase family protein [Candidatus Ratteibacteria bacterium]|jgi:peptidoglycan/xylan/chitin deacetylase (PgdA/CDA1 family)